MQTTELQLNTLTFKSSRTYLLASAFIIGNLLLPQLLHFVPQGGTVWLPIYFFTLVGAYRYGWKVGVLTAILSPVINSLLFGMPAAAALPLILIKSVALAAVAGTIADHFKRATLWSILLVILAYQTIGVAAEWVMSGSLMQALTSVKIAIPGLLVQLFGGYFVMKSSKLFTKIN